MGDDDRYNRVRDLLLAHADRPPGFWPWLQELNGAPADVKSANKFFVACTVDYQQNAKKAWANVRHWAEQTMGDPPDLLHRIAAVTAHEWQTKKSDYALHWIAAGHRRVRDIAVRVVIAYGGDARRIWKGQTGQPFLQRWRREFEVRGYRAHLPFGGVYGDTFKSHSHHPDFVGLLCAPRARL